MADTFFKLDSVTVGAGGAASVTFSNIPQTYTDLVVKYSTRCSGSGQFQQVYLRMNGDTSAVYSGSRFWYYAGFASNYYIASTQNVMNWTSGSTATANTFGTGEITIPNYTSSRGKSFSSELMSESNSATEVVTSMASGLYTTTNPITSLTIIGETSFVQNSTFTLYGVFNQDVSSAPATPTIGTASDNGIGGASVAFTGVSGAASYVATSTPSGITGTGTASPITVSGLDFGTAYTFKVKALNPIGQSAESAASNSVTPLSAFESIATNTLGSNANSITFSSIPSTYKHLQLRGFARKSGGTGIADVTVTFNGDSGANYTRSWTFTFDGAGPYTSRGTSSNGFSMGYFANNGSDSLFGSYVLDIVDYANTNKFKTAQYLNGAEKTSAGNTVMLHGTGSWLNTAAISSITLSCSDITAGSTFALYGIKG